MYSIRSIVVLGLDSNSSSERTNIAMQPMTTQGIQVELGPEAEGVIHAKKICHVGPDQLRQYPKQLETTKFRNLVATAAISALEQKLQKSESTLTAMLGGISKRIRSVHDGQVKFQWKTSMPS